MGRKIPGKKHRRNTDPEKQLEKRESELKLKINSAPKFIDDQEVPKKLQQMIRLKEDVKNRKKIRKEPRTSNDDLIDSRKHMGMEMKLPGMKKDLKPIPVFQQNPGEKNRQFFRRVNQQVEQFMKQKSYEAKYNVDLVRDEQSGKTKFVEREKDELDEHVNKLKAKKLEKKGIVLKSKEEKRKERRLKEKEKRMKKSNGVLKNVFKQIQHKEEDFDDSPERPEFNDIVHAPPSKLIGIKNNEARRPGKSKDLIFLDSDKMKQKSVKKSPKQLMNENTKSKKKVKQRISLAKQQMLEADRLSIIDQYRKLKQKNNHF